MTVRIKVLRCYVWSTLIYGCETRTISVAMQKKLDAFEKWLYRRMLRISWKDMEHLVVTGFVDGKRARGKQRETFLTYLGKFTNKPPMELLRLANDIVVWSKLCAE